MVKTDIIMCITLRLGLLLHPTTAVEAPCCYHSRRSGEVSGQHSHRDWQVVHQQICFHQKVCMCAYYQFSHFCERPLAIWTFWPCIQYVLKNTLMLLPYCSQQHPLSSCIRGCLTFHVLFWHAHGHSRWVNGLASINHASPSPTPILRPPRAWLPPH